MPKPSPSLPAENEPRRVPFAQAQVIAWKARATLLPWCDRIEIAGSIRRRKATVKDVELLVIPRAASRDLFGAVTGDSATAYLAEAVKDAHGPWALRLSKAGYRTFGLENKLLTYEGFPVDVFTSTPELWGMRLVVRTGPMEFNVRMMARFRQLGMRGHAYAGAVDDAEGNPIPCPTEENVFRLLRWNWIPPEERT